MNRANKKTGVSKTDLCRYLNTHSDKFPAVKKFWAIYMERCVRARKVEADQFGFWLRANHRDAFEKIYPWAVLHPEILVETYGNPND